jgi:uncharacterized protein
MFIIDTREIPEGHSILDRQVRLELQEDDPIRLAENIACRIEFDRLQTRIYAQCSYIGGAEFQCARCLETFVRKIEGRFSLNIKDTTAQSAPLDDEDDSFDLFFSEQQTEISLHDIFIEEILTELPMKPLCSPDCRGTLQSSNAGIDFGAHDQNGSIIDPRWEAMRKLKK